MTRSHYFTQKHLKTIGIGWLLASIVFSFLLIMTFTNVSFDALQKELVLPVLSTWTTVFLILSAPVWTGFISYYLFVKPVDIPKGKIRISLCFFSLFFVLYVLGYNLFFALPVILASAVLSLTAWAMITLFYRGSFSEKFQHLVSSMKRVAAAWLVMFSIGATWLTFVTYSEDVVTLRNQLIMGNAINQARFTALCKNTIGEKYPALKEQLPQFVEKHVCHNSTSHSVLAFYEECQKKNDSALCLNKVCDKLHAGQYRQEVFVNVDNGVRMEVCKLNMPIQKKKDASASVTLG